MIPRMSAALHLPAYLAVRTFTAALTTLTPRAAMDAARAAGRLYATSRPNRKRLERARAHLRVAFPDWPGDRIEDYAARSYEHLFALGAEIAFAPRLLTGEGWARHVVISNVGPALRELLSARPCVLITGHAGNWEVLGYVLALLGFPVHALYRPLDSPPLDRWVRRTRERCGLTLVDKFGAVTSLPGIIRAGSPVAFVADQNGGDRGVFVPFFNRLCSTYKSIGLLALHHNATIMCAVAPRLPARDEAALSGRSVPAVLADTRGVRHVFQVVDVFGPAEWNTHPDPLFYLTARYRRAIENSIRLAPEQYLWMHRNWRSRPAFERSNKPFPAALEEKIRLLPWITGEDVERIKEHSARDARTLAATGQSRLS